jgi:anti-sigma regulatory factor (Ser/Thr protein kinase)
MNETLTLRLTGGPTAPGRARTALQSLDRSLSDLREEVNLLVSELVTNSVRHARAKRIELKASTTPQGVRVEVTDGGPGFEPETRRAPQDAGADGGFGLLLVDKLANRWGIERDARSRVWFEIDRRRREGQELPADDAERAAAIS